MIRKREEQIIHKLAETLAFMEHSTKDLLHQKTIEKDCRITVDTDKGEAITFSATIPVPNNYNDFTEWLIGFGRVLEKNCGFTLQHFRFKEFEK